ncbi:hypothetical protein N7450_011252 [Penicillium hetheringtonii]|uniref:Uncharacterized protein n=1 Tax=Penicillium hetheringtonii TaxID=911720 RepID=A0AAD6D9L2_9EURO|nr:hypothetical protein N7450_011252 [Penicillium hetheringtonii]
MARGMLQSTISLTFIQPRVMIDGVIPETVEYEDLLPSALEDSERKAKAAAARTFKVEPGNTLKDGRYRPFEN